MFADLLRAIGVQAQILDSINQLQAETRIITEPQFLPRLRPEQAEKCLIVGNKGVLEGLPVQSLSRPLTEEKIETALSQFLNS